MQWFFNESGKQPPFTNEFIVPREPQIHEERPLARLGLWQSGAWNTTSFPGGKRASCSLREKSHLIQGYVYIVVMHIYILNLRAIKRERKWQIILTATKKEKYIKKKKTRMVICVLKRKTFYSLYLFPTPHPHLLCVICRSILFQSLGRIV